MRIKVKKFHSHEFEVPDLQVTEKGDWIDLPIRKVQVVANNCIDIKKALMDGRENDVVDEEYEYEAGQVVVIHLGYAMHLPRPFSANIYPRSSTFANTGLMLSNSIGCIDNSYNGEEDEWKAVFYATRAGKVSIGDRLCQFGLSIEETLNIEFDYVNKLNNKNRDGFGSTGR